MLLLLMTASLFFGVISKFAYSLTYHDRKKSNARLSLARRLLSAKSWLPICDFPTTRPRAGGVLAPFSFWEGFAYPSHFRPVLLHRLQDGCASSHFTRRILHVVHPERDLWLPSLPLVFLASSRYAAAVTCHSAWLFAILCRKSDGSVCRHASCQTAKTRLPMPESQTGGRRCSNLPLSCTKWRGVTRSVQASLRCHQKMMLCHQ